MEKMARIDLGVYVVMAMLGFGFLLSLQATLSNPTQINLDITAITFIGTALLVAFALYRGRDRRFERRFRRH